MGKLLMKILYSILCFTAVTLCSARELYVTKNWNDAKIQELYYATDNTKTIPHKTTVSFRYDGKNLLIRAVMNVKKIIRSPLSPTGTENGRPRKVLKFLLTPVPMARDIIRSQSA
jgi:hypothetical protein